jgi:hypothetical protein
VGIADQTQIELFTSLGEMRSPFQGIAEWPWIDDCFAAASARLLKERGTEKWGEITGGEYDKNGRPTLRSSSPLTAKVVQEAADNHGGFLWQDRDAIGWAVKLGRQLAGDGTGRFAFCINWAGNALLLDQAARKNFGSTVSQASPLQGEDEREPARHHLEKAAKQMRLFNRAEQLLWIIHGAVLMQRSSVVVLPDTMLAKVIWGGARREWPQNWRQDVMESLRSLTYLRSEVLRLNREGWQPQLGAHSVGIAHVEQLSITRPEEDRCRQSCPLFNRPERHSHILVQIGYGFLGVLEKFLTGDDGHGIRNYDFNPQPLDKIGKKKSSPAKRTFRSVNLLVSVFGPAKWSQLSNGQQQIIQGLTGEITRSSNKHRPDHAQVFRGNEVPHPSNRSTVACPFLGPDTRFIAFGGNLKRRGLGYRIIGQKNRGWLFKCGYHVQSDPKLLAKCVRKFLKELKGVAKILGLVVAAIDPKTCDWFDHEMLMQIARQRRGWKEIDRLHLRVYGPEDYLERCRGYFEEQGAFSEIAGVALHDNQARLQVAKPSLKVRLQQMNVTQEQLAQRLGISRSWVTQLLNGQSNWPEPLKQEVEDVISAFEQQDGASVRGNIAHF